MTAFEEIQKAKSLIASSKRVEARQVLSALVQSEPSNAQAWFLLSHVVDDRNQAIYCLERAIKIDPLNPEIRERMKLFRPQNEAEPKKPITPTPVANVQSIPLKNDQPIYSIIILLSISILIWMGIGLLQLSAAQLVSESSSLCFIGLWNLFATFLNGYMLYFVIQKKKSIIRSLNLFSLVGMVLGAWQLFFDSVSIQACIIPLYAAIMFFTYVERDKFVN